MALSTVLCTEKVLLLCLPGNYHYGMNKNRNSRIGIIAAMQLELDGFLSNLENREEVLYGKFRYYTGTINSREVIIMLCGVGKVNAAVGTTLLIDKMEPDYIINTGVAGGFSNSLNLGDLIVSTEVSHHDADITVFNYQYGQIPDMPPSFKADPHLVDLAMEAFPENVQIAIHRGKIISGDSFIHKDSQIEGIRKNFTDIAAVEMEGSAIAQTCHLFSVPFVVIRSISDLVCREASHSDYQKHKQTAADLSVRLVLNLVDKI